MKQETFGTDKREKIHEPFWRTIIRTSLTGLAISIAFRFGQLKDEPELIAHNHLFRPDQCR
jgi:hypothetical protein